MEARALGAPIGSAPNITTPPCENTVVLHSKIDHRMAEVGQKQTPPPELGQLRLVTVAGLLGVGMGPPQASS